MPLPAQASGRWDLANALLKLHEDNAGDADAGPACTCVSTTPHPPASDGSPRWPNGPHLPHPERARPCAVPKPLATSRRCRPSRSPPTWPRAWLGPDAERRHRTTAVFGNFHQTTMVSSTRWPGSPHAEDHHPDLALSYGCTVRFNTHSWYPINDFICAAKVDALLALSERNRCSLVVAAHGRHVVHRDGRQGQRLLYHPARAAAIWWSATMVRWQPAGDEGASRHVEPRRNLVVPQDAWRSKSFAANPGPGVAAGGRRTGCSAESQLTGV